MMAELLHLQLEFEPRTIGGREEPFNLSPDHARVLANQESITGNSPYVPNIRSKVHVRVPPELST